MPSLANGQCFQKSRSDATVRATGQRTGVGMGTATREEEVCGGEGSNLKSQGERGASLWSVTPAEPCAVFLTGWWRVSLQSTPRLLWLPRLAAAVSHLHSTYRPLLTCALQGHIWFPFLHEAVTTHAAPLRTTRRLFLALFSSHPASLH